MGPHGYSVWGHSSKLCNNGKGCNAIDMKGPCHAHGGPHWMVAETSYYAGEKVSIAYDGVKWCIVVSVNVWLFVCFCLLRAIVCVWVC
ncbi:hypothetical protein EON63_02545 [archaeon]|nr:MAG: hypothetical protein EON63_02545 [archaeon]